jgi:hypothetical protein
MRRAAFNGGEQFARRFQNAAHHRKAQSWRAGRQAILWKTRRGGEVNARARPRRSVEATQCPLAAHEFGQARASLARQNEDVPPRNRRHDGEEND